MGWPRLGSWFSQFLDRVANHKGGTVVTPKECIGLCCVRSGELLFERIIVVGCRAILRRIRDYLEAIDACRAALCHAASRLVRHEPAF